MGFSREVARKCLAAYMFKTVKPKTKQRHMIDHVLTELSSVGVFKVHGRMVNANTAKTELKLDVELLGKDDALWKDLWQYYVRADVAMKRSQHSKLIETKNEILMRGV